MNKRLRPLMLIALAASAGCASGTSTGGVLPFSNAQAVQAVTVQPTALKFTQTGAAFTQTVVAGTQFAGDLTAVSSNGTIATVNPPDQTVSQPVTGAQGVKTATFTVTAVGAGNCTITVTDKKGNVATVSVSVVANTPQVHVLHQYAISGGDVSFGITDAADGSVWYGQFTGSAIGHVSSTGANANYGIGGSSQPYGITLGPDQNFWVADYAGHRIVVMNAFGSVVASYATSYAPLQISKGPDGNLWFTQEDDSGATGYSEVTRLTTAGTMTHFPTSAAAQAARRFASDIVAGPDGNLWFTEGSAVGSVSTSGTLVEYPTPTGHQTQYITAGPDGNLWVTEPYGNHIARVSTAGVFTEFPVPALPWQIAPGKDGALWFSEMGGGQIGSITTSGTEAQFPISGLTGQPAILAGNDGNLWLTSNNGTMFVLSY